MPHRLHVKTMLDPRSEREMIDFTATLIRARTEIYSASAKQLIPRESVREREKEGESGR